MSKKIYPILSLLVILSMFLGACSSATETDAPEPTSPPAPDATDMPLPTDIPMPGEGMKVCQVTDVGGIDDKSFNATAWKGVEDAMDAFGVDGIYLESQQQSDYELNINAFLEDDCDLIVTVGFLLGDATAAAAAANPDQLFAIVDVDFFDFVAFEDVTFDNAKELTFLTDQAAFLAGYAAAGTTSTGIVGTFGGINIPPVTIFMDGFYFGVQYYNEQHGTDVQVLGWNPVTADGLFTGNFESTDDGRAMGESLMDEGADIIMPVAGPVGLGTAAAAQERGGVFIIGVDSNWTVSAAEYADIVLTSVLKNMDVAIYETTQAVVEGTFEGGLYIGTLENGGVGLAALHESVSAELAAELDTVKQIVMAGMPEPTPDFKVCQVTDVGGIDDKSFNATAWKGVQDAMSVFGIDGIYLESQQQSDYEVNINAFLEDDCDLIVTVGFLLGDATAAAAAANPDQLFAIVDVDFFDFVAFEDVTFDNAKELTFLTDQAAFLAGYAAAGTTQTGVIGTFGGIPIPPVTIFMDGFYYGAMYYNEVHGTDVQVLGWDPANPDLGLFTGNFESTDDGRAMGISLMDEGADIIMPVAGPVGLGTAAAAQERGGVLIVGVDSDWTISAAEYADIVLTSVLKNMDIAIFDTVADILNNSFEGGLYVGTLANGGVGLATLNCTDCDDLLAELEDLKAALIAGDVSIYP